MMSDSPLERTRALDEFFGTESRGNYSHKLRMALLQRTIVASIIKYILLIQLSELEEQLKRVA